jgi:D-tyrosyl-tRNA(Tyr) deacylase
MPMRAVVQRVSSARVLVDEQVVGRIGPGLLVFIGVESGDTDTDARYIAGKIAELRAFEDPGDVQALRRLNRSLVDIGGAVLLVSQFTICGDCRRGRRPSFDGAAAPDLARGLYERVAAEIRARGLHVETGRFQETMRVELSNEGPVTLLLDSRKVF